MNSTPVNNVKPIKKISTSRTMMVQPESNSVQFVQAYPAYPHPHPNQMNHQRMGQQIPTTANYEEQRQKDYYSKINSIRNGIRSHNLEKQVAAILSVCNTLPPEMMEENVFVKQLKEGVRNETILTLVAAVKDFIMLVIPSTFQLVFTTIQIHFEVITCYFMMISTTLTAAQAGNPIVLTTPVTPLCPAPSEIPDSLVLLNLDAKNVSLTAEKAEFEIQIAPLQVQVAGLQTENEALKFENESLKSENAFLRTENDSHRTQSYSLKTDLEKSQAEMEALKKTADKLILGLATKESELKTFEETKKQVENLTSTVAFNKTVKQKLKDEIKTQKADLRISQEKNAEMAEKIKELEGRLEKCSEDRIKELQRIKESFMAKIKTSVELRGVTDRYIAKSQIIESQLAEMYVWARKNQPAEKKDPKDERIRTERPRKRGSTLGKRSSSAVSQDVDFGVSEKKTRE
ncbi:hypothetical protein L596_020915 [Steinernema carpocapsae]|uniref:Uncharacterized protein n=1 Tax=Steinernema carpocapsae TaxID=34508 RepID=A0A4U5MVK4_STECR|nr:hypothetical protein L596_020915 [Steinernema carpocapsae]